MCKGSVTSLQQNESIGKVHFLLPETTLCLVYLAQIKACPKTEQWNNKCMKREASNEYSQKNKNEIGQPVLQEHGYSGNSCSEEESSRVW